jgi:hypothetical protein
MRPLSKSDFAPRNDEGMEAVFIVSEQGNVASFRLLSGMMPDLPEDDRRGPQIIELIFADE